MKALRQPSLQTRLGRRQIHTGHANLGESQFMGAGLDVGNQLALIDSHPLIVETGNASPLALPGEAATQAWAQALAQALQSAPLYKNTFIALQGELGAGKTTLVRHLLHALGVAGRVKSPTYAVVEPYSVADWAIWHFDFYRFEDPQEWEDAGFRDIFASPGLKLAEWPDKAVGLLPLADLTLHLQADPQPQNDDARWLSLSAATPAGRALAALLHKLPQGRAV